MPRRRQSSPFVVISTAALMGATASVTVPAVPARAQIAATNDFPLLAPTLDGNPRNPPLFRQASSQTGDPAAPPVSQLPDFGALPGTGAGSTGFNSSNTGSGLRGSQGVGAMAQGTAGPDVQPAPTAAPVQLVPAPPASAIAEARLQQNKNRARQGAPSDGATTNAAITNAGAAPSAPASPGLDPASAPPKTLIRRPAVDDKPFDPLGVRAGSFLLRPAIEVSGGYDTNPARTNGSGGASNFGIVAPELQVNSDWSRHELTASLRGSYTAYGTATSLDRPAFDGRIDGRVDVTGRTRIDLESRLVVATDNPGSPNIQAGLARLPISTDVGDTIGLGQRFNRFDVEIKGGIDRTTYQNSVFTDGTVASNDDRNFDQYSTQLRAGYEATPGVQPFVEIDVDRRHHDLALDSFGFDRDSDGRAAKIGTTFELSRILTGQLAFGYLERIYADPALLDIEGPTFDGSLTWVASALTTFRLTAVTSVSESTLAGVSGEFTHEVGIEVDHAFRTWLDAALKFTGDRDAYVGLARVDDRYAAVLDLTYKLNRETQLKGELRREWLASNMPANNYQAYVALLGVRLQR